MSYSISEIRAVAEKLTTAPQGIAGAPDHTRIEFGPVKLANSRERQIASDMPELLLQHLPKLRTERPSQPTQIKAGQVWQSRKSGGQIRIKDDAPYGINWVRVSGNGHREGTCFRSTLRDKYDYVEG